MFSRVSTILENLDILKGPSRSRTFKKKVLGKLVSDFLTVKGQKTAGRFKILPVGSKDEKKDIRLSKNK